MFWHVFKTKLRVLLRNKSCLFWVLAFPFIMAIMFKAAFGNFNAMREAEPAKVAVVEKSLATESGWREFFSGINENENYEINYMSLEDAKRELAADELAGYIEFDGEKAHLFINDNNMQQMLIKNALDQYAELQNTAGVIAQSNLEYLISKDGFAKVLEEDFVSDASDEKIDFTINYFFTLMAMAALYASLIGLELAKNNEANLSTKGARAAIAPTDKTLVMLADMAAGFVICFAQQLALYLFIKYPLGIELAGAFWQTMLINAVGVLAGLSLGIFVGASNSKSEGFKNGLLIGATMLCCFFSGMMGDPRMRAIFDDLMPTLSKLNPINNISDGHYALFAYGGDMEYYWAALGRIAIFAGIMLVLSLILSRRKRYDSI